MAKTPSKSSSKSKPATTKPATTKPKAPKVSATAKATTTTSKASSLRSKTKAVSTRPTAARKTTTATTPKLATPTLVSVDTSEKRTELEKKDLIDRIAEESGMKKGEVRTALDATLIVLRQALQDGSNLSIAPLGKLKIAREKQTPNGKLVVAKIKLKDGGASKSKDPLAKPAE